MNVYISGKIGSDTITEPIRRKFAKAQAFLESLGCKVTNPVSSEEQAIFREFDETLDKVYTGKDSYAHHLFYDISSLMYCDAIFMLSDYKDSPGARAELAFAQAIGMEVVYQDGLFE